jgi:ribosome-associated toxin RatA of RatAB toxin-antitoxin module
MSKNSIIIHAPLNKVFAAAADLGRWPEFLPHYRYNRFTVQTPSGGTVKMACVHAGVRLTWLSEYRIDTERHELHFRHLRAVLNATRGMEVIWKFEERPEGGVQVSITHELELHWPVIGSLLGNRILDGFFVRRIAEKTLAGLKRKLEAQQRLGDQLAIPPLALPAVELPQREKKRKSGGGTSALKKKAEVRSSRTGESRAAARTAPTGRQARSSKSSVRAPSKAVSASKSSRTWKAKS